MQRVFSSNEPYSKSREFQKETALRATEFELFVKRSPLFRKEQEKKEGIPEVHSLRFIGGGRILGEKRQKVLEPDRQLVSLPTDWRAARGIRARRELWTGR